MSEASLTKKIIIGGLLLITCMTVAAIPGALEYAKTESRAAELTKEIENKEQIIRKQTAQFNEISREKENIKIENQKLNDEVIELRRKQNTASRGIRGTKLGVFEATAYGGGGICADGHPAMPGVIAADTDVLPLGTRVYVEFDGASHHNGIYTVHDRGNAVTGNMIDVYMNDGWHEFGRRNCRVTILD